MNSSINIFKKLTLLLLTLIVSIPSHAQNLTSLDDSFIDGLKPSIKESVEAQNELDSQGEIEKLFRAETSVEKNKVILNRLKKEISSLEKKYEDQIKEEGSQILPRFGASFFRSLQSSFMPVNVPNLGANYIIDVGDVFEIMLTGKVEERTELMVTRDGSISVVGVGKINVLGKSLQDAEDHIRAIVETSAFGVEVFVSLAKLRDSQVLILGQVENPGIYTLTGGSTVISALDVAGGINENGSYRKIEHRRNGELVESIDLYDVLVFGKFIFENTLRSGDTVFIHPINYQVPVSGGVNVPARYEAIPGETVEDVIKYASGFSSYFTGYDQVSLQRVSLESTQVIDLSLNDLSSTPIGPRDSVLVPSFKNELFPVKKVLIEGMVRRPGEYIIQENDTLSKIIKKAGGYKEGAYVYGAALFREEALNQEKLFAQLNYSDTINYIISNIGKANSSINDSVLSLLSEEIRARYYEGRVITNFNLDEIKNSSLDIELQDMDRIMIPQIQKVVYLFGDFRRPSNYFYDPSIGPYDYIKMAGGLRDSAYDEILVIDPDGRTHTINASNIFFSGKNVDIYPGSIIYAQRDIGKLSGLSYASAVAPILSGLAISLASLNSISND